MGNEINGGNGMVENDLRDKKGEGRIKQEEKEGSHWEK
jgi:hypothetical protein